MTAAAENFIIEGRKRRDGRRRTDDRLERGEGVALQQPKSPDIAPDGQES